MNKGSSCIPGSSSTSKTVRIGGFFQKPGLTHLPDYQITHLPNLFNPLPPVSTQLNPRVPNPTQEPADGSQPARTICLCNAHERSRSKHIRQKVATRSPDHVRCRRSRRSRRFLRPIPIPDWRRVQQLHPRSSQFGVGFTQRVLIGVGFEWKSEPPIALVGVVFWPKAKSQKLRSDF
jgi:hypothetical protein